MPKDDYAATSRAVTQRASGDPTATNARPTTSPVKHEDDHWLVISGRRWRKTDPSLPDEVVTKLKRHLGRARSEVGRAKRQGDTDAEEAARRRVDLAKHGLGERGPYWWDEPVDARLARARDNLAQLAELE